MNSAGLVPHREVEQRGKGRGTPTARPRHLPDGATADWAAHQLSFVDYVIREAVGVRLGVQNTRGVSWSMGFDTRGGEGRIPHTCHPARNLGKVMSNIPKSLVHGEY